MPPSLCAGRSFRLKPAAGSFCYWLCRLKEPLSISNIPPAVSGGHGMHSFNMAALSSPLPPEGTGGGGGVVQTLL
ncbi:hypothetical protein EYF80_017868 [Liparis tanakae]|uniref:Uncharacterized protein n=1 Tax=Liparis tanakae TaxID=230148 RepID=A0A4Z2I261_9TELE|nr:hypothetical protein EYF80_017868 [Liparis tanakae]